MNTKRKNDILNLEVVTMGKQAISIFEFANHFGFIWLNGDREAMKRPIIEKSINNILTTLSICVFSIVPTHVECVALMSRA